MNEPVAANTRRLPPRLRFELIFASVCLAFGLFVLPAAIFGVGNLLLGPYGAGAGLGTFYLDFFADLATPSGRTWLIALGPLALLWILRLLLRTGRAAKSSDDAPQQTSPPRVPESTRVEPKVTLD